jgi:hypothetical protein
MNIAAAVTTAPRRVSYLAQTLRSLERGGFSQPIVAADAPDPTIEPAYPALDGGFAALRIERAERRLGAFRNWRRALRALLTSRPEADAFAVFQDDVRVSRHLHEWLEEHLWPDAHRRLGVVSLYTAEPHVRVTDGWHKLSLASPSSRAFGALAYVFPYSVAALLLAEEAWGRGDIPIDAAVGEFCRRNHRGYWLHSPSLVQHLGEVSTLSDFGLTPSRRAGRFLQDALQPQPVSAVLLNWKRPFHLNRIVSELTHHEFIDEIVIWNNAPEPLAIEDLHLARDVTDVRIINSDENVGTYGRFLAARVARNPIIYTQDDDCVVTAIERLYQRFIRHAGRITAGLVHGHFDAEAHRRPWMHLGWGSFFLRDWTEVLDPWIERYGVDHLLYRKADRIFTTLFDRHDPHRTQIERLLGSDGGPSDRDSHALWLRPDHLRLTQEAVTKALGLRTNSGKGKRSTVLAMPQGPLLPS